MYAQIFRSKFFACKHIRSCKEGILKSWGSVHLDQKCDFLLISS